MGIHPYSVQWSHTTIDTSAAKEGGGLAGEGRTTVGGERVQPSGQEEAPALPVPKAPLLPRGTVGVQGAAARGDRHGKNQSVAISGDTDGQNMTSSRYGVQIEWNWVALRDNEFLTTGARPVPATAELLQPDELHADPAFRPTKLATSEEPSVLTRMGEAIYTVVGAKGGGAQQREIRNRDRTIPVRALWNALPASTYKATMMRALSGNAPVVIDDRIATMKSTPVGRPQIARVWFPYSQQVLEAQVGREGAHDTSSMWGAAGGGSGTILGHGFAEGAGAAPRGSGRTGSELHTDGSYRGVYQDAPMALVRTKVINETTLPNGQIARTEGEALVNVLLSKVQEHRYGFDDPNNEIRAYYDRRVAEAQTKFDKAKTDNAEPADLQKHKEALDTIVEAQGDVVADDVAATTDPPMPHLDGDLAPPAALADGLSGAVVWSLQFAGGLDQAGLGALTDALTTRARALGGPALVTAVTPLATWVGPLMAKLSDGGESWVVNVDGDLYLLAIWAGQLGPPHGSRPGGTGQKIYERSNDYADAGRKVIRENAGTGSASGVSFLDDLPVRAGITYSYSTRLEENLNRGSNLLSMSGVRANKLTDFTQGVRFQFLLEKLRPEWRPGTGRPIDVTPANLVTIEELHVASVPTEGTTPAGRPRPRYPFRLVPHLPAEYRTTGMRGLQALFEAVKSTGLADLRDGAAFDAPADALVYERLAPSLPAMLTPGGSRHSAIVNAVHALDLGSGHVTVHARFGEIGQIYFMEKAEFEKYNHGTDLVSSQDAGTRRHAVGFDGYAMGPVAAPPFAPVLAWAGGRFTAAFETGYLAGSDRTAWIEHRAWLRQDSAVFFIYTTLELMATVSPASGAAPVRVPTIGLVELVTDRDGALELGITLDALKAVVPADKWSKVFSDDPADGSPPPSPALTPVGLNNLQATLPGLYAEARDTVLALQHERRKAEIAAARADRESPAGHSTDEEEPANEPSGSSAGTRAGARPGIRRRGGTGWWGINRGGSGRDPGIRQGKRPMRPSV
jgi:hypothetical protein